ncbi:MAG TPA: hypothetical protein VM537_28110 [Anaerolineae bacterium]|nr:hypothetical protein [Anaerolineae bacterium]
MMTAIAPARVQSVTVPHMGKPATCHLCGGEVHSDCDPKRNGWLICTSCGPVWMPLAGRWIRVHVACSLAEASERAARLVLALEGGSL